MIQELSRVHYLQAMGVTSYVPRFALPGAKPSVLCAMPVVVTEVATKASRMALNETLTTSEKPSPGVAPLSRPVVEPIAAVVPVFTTAEATISPFCLLFVSTDSGLLFVADIPRGRAGKMWGDNGRHFITELLFAVNRHAIVVSSEDFSWPISRHLGGAETEVIQALSGFMQRVQSEHRLTDVVAMGGRARYFMSKLLDAGAVSFYQSHSLKSLFENPRQKALLWQQLQTIGASH